MHYHVKLRHQGYSKATRKAIREAARRRREEREDRIDVEIARKALAELDKIGPVYRPDQVKVTVAGVEIDPATYGFEEDQPARVPWPPDEDSEYGVPIGRDDDKEG